VSIGLLSKRTPLALIRDEVQESLTLDYKRSSALGKWNTERNNLSKDISAFANSEGGMLIYGMEENGVTCRPPSTRAWTGRRLLTSDWRAS